MFYWIIPYLVAYNVSDTAVWKNGPIHTFAAQVEGSVLTDADYSVGTTFTMVFTCRPTIAESTIDCRVQNATIDNYDINEDNSDAARVENATVYDPMFPINFHVEFDMNGVKEVTFPKRAGSYREGIIRSIVDNLNVGIDPSDKNFGHYVSVDESMNGVCPTSFDIKKIPRQIDEVTIEENNDVLNMTSTIPAVLSDEQTLVIEKDRKMHKCTRKTPYILGKEEQYDMDPKVGSRMQFEIVSSRSEISLGKNRFNSYSEHSGVMQVQIKGGYKKNTESTKMKGKTSEVTRLSLISIHQATDE